MTQRIQINPGAVDDHRLLELARVLDAGGVAAVPTDTVYGLAANALNAAAVEQVFVIKGRESGKPLPIVVRDLAQAGTLTEHPSPWFYSLARKFWPGPLTLIVPARPGLPPALTAGSGTIAMRQPGSIVLDAILRHLAYPLTATSANLSGMPACTSAGDVAAQLGDRVQMIVDAGPSPRAVPSTIVDLTAGLPRIVRPGAIAVAELEPLWRDPAR